MTELLATDFRRRSIGDYLTAISNGVPTPGGGSAAGLAGVLGCSLGEMVCNLTLVKGEHTALTRLAKHLAGLADDLIDLAARDEQVFGAYRTAVALPRSNDEEKLARRAAIEQALVEAAEVPLQMIEVAFAAIDRLRLTSEFGTPHALGDLMTGGFLLQAMALGSLENVEANAVSMKTPENRERFVIAAMAARQQLDLEMIALERAVTARRS